MSGVDDFFVNLGIINPNNREALNKEFAAYAATVAVDKLSKTELSDEERQVLKTVSETGKLDSATLEKLFNTPEREVFLQQGMVEALKILQDSAKEETV